MNGPVDSPHKGPVTRKMLPFDDVILKTIYCLWLRHGHDYKKIWNNKALKVWPQKPHNANNQTISRSIKIKDQYQFSWLLHFLRGYLHRKWVLFLSIESQLSCPQFAALINNQTHGQWKAIRLMKEMPFMVDSNQLHFKKHSFMN